MKKATPLTLTATALGALAFGIAAPAVAQEASPQTVTPPPVVLPSADPPPVLTAPTPAPPVVTPVPQPRLVLPEVTLAPEPVRVTRSVRAAEPAQRSPRQAATQPQASAATPVAEARSVQPVETAPPAEATRDIAEPAPVQPAAIAATESGVVTTTPADNDLATWEIVGGIAGLGLLGGAALLAFGRSRRPTPDEIPDDEPMVVTGKADAPPVAKSDAQPSRPIESEPVFAPAMAGAAGHGRHERLAAMGPTPENPFLTRKARVRRARFYDRRERIAAETQPTQLPAPKPRDPAPQPSDQVTISFGKDRSTRLGGLIGPRTA